MMMMIAMMTIVIPFARWWLSNWRRGDGLLVAARYDHRDWSHQSIPFLLLHLINIHHHSINIFYAAFWSSKPYPEIYQHQSWGCEIFESQKDVSYSFLFVSKKMETKHTTSLALNCRAQNNKVGQGYRSFRVPLSEAKLGHLGWHYLLAHPLCIWRSQNTTKLIYWLKRVEETLGCILFATGWMNSQKHIKCWTTIKLMKFLWSEFDITLLNLNEVCIQFY